MQAATLSGKTHSCPYLGRWRWTLVLGVLSLLLLWSLFQWPRLFFALGIHTYGTWFLDSFALLATFDALRVGLDPFVPNPLDIFGRPHVYSSWWLSFEPLGLGRADSFWVGGALLGAFLSVALFQLRPSCGRQALYAAMVLFSPPLLLAYNRTNNDLVIFLLLAPLPWFLLRPEPTARLCAPLLVGIGLGLKYYPLAAALVLLAQGGRREILTRLGLFALIVACVLLSLTEDLLRIRELIPPTEGVMTFGATALPVSQQWKGRFWVPLTIALGLALVALLWRRVQAVKIPRAERREQLMFVVGASLLCACFWLGMNHGYRWIFAVWLVPYFWRGGFAPLDSGQRDKLVRRSAGLLLLLLWTDTLTVLVVNLFLNRVPLQTLLDAANWVYALEQIFAWTFFGHLLALLIRFVKTELELLRAS